MEDTVLLRIVPLQIYSFIKAKTLKCIVTTLVIGLHTTANAQQVIDHVDLDGLGKSALLVRSLTSPPSLKVGRYSGSSFVFADIADPGPNFRVLGATRLDAGPKSDLLIQNISTGEFGEARSLLDFDASKDRLLRNVKRTWDVQAVGDLDGDGFGDLVWRYMADDPRDTGVSFIWFTNGAADSNATVQNPTNVAQVRKRGGAPLSWTLLGARDINGDGAADMVYISPEGNIRVLMATPARTCANLFAGTVPVGMTALKFANFSGDGRGDILYRNTVTGAVALAKLNATGLTLPPFRGQPDDPNASCTSSTLVVTNTAVANLPMSDPNWTLYGVGDFDGNGTTDIVWLQPSGQLTLWLMNTNGAVPTQVANAGSVCSNSSRPASGVSLGFNVNALFWESHYSDPALLAAVRTLSSPVLRVPGGTEADYYDWDKGRPVDACRYGPCRTWDAATLVPPGLFQRFGSFSRGTTDAFVTLAREVNGSPLFVANTVTASVEDNLRWLAAARNAGSSIQRVELANEPYFGRVEGTDNNERLFPTAASHVAVTRTLATAIRRQSPTAVLAYPAFVPRVNVATGSLEAGHDERMLTWTQRALDAGIAQDVDAFALHFYPRLPGRQGATDSAYLAVLAEYPAAYWRATLATPQWATLPPDKRLWITELNASFTDAPELVGSWMHGLMQAQLVVLALQDPRMDMVLQHMLTGNAQWQAVVHPGRTPDVVPAPGYRAYALTSTGETMAAVSAALTGARSVQPIPTSAPGAVAVLGEGPNGTQLVVINAGATSFSLDVRTQGWTGATARSLTASPFSRIAGGGEVTRTDLVAEAGGLSFRMPPWSITTITRAR